MKRVEDVHILVVGDIMLDKYVVGNVTRISPEAPVPVVNVSGEYSSLGGCGNVAANLRALGVRVDVLAAISNDTYGRIVCSKLENLGIKSILYFGSEMTTCKERIVADARQIQMLRIDRESTKEIDAKLLIQICEDNIAEESYDFILISDYAKGVITGELLNYLKSKDIPIVVDPKPKNAPFYKDIFLITPNENEYNEMVLRGFKKEDCEYTLITKGKRGMELFTRGKEQSLCVPATPVEVYNVSGAGDVVAATLCTSLASGIDIETSVKISNDCAGYSVTKVGTCVINRQKYQDILSKYL